MLAKGKGIRSSVIPLAIIAGMVFAVAAGIGGGEDPAVTGSGDHREAVLAAAGEFNGWSPDFAEAGNAEADLNRKDAIFETAAEFNGWSASAFEGSALSRAQQAEVLRLKGQAEYYLFGGIYVGTRSDGTSILAK